MCPMDPRSAITSTFIGPLASFMNRLLLSRALLSLLLLLCTLQSWFFLFRFMVFDKGLA